MGLFKNYQRERIDKSLSDTINSLLEYAKAVDNKVDLLKRRVVELERKVF